MLDRCRTADEPKDEDWRDYCPNGALLNTIGA